MVGRAQGRVVHEEHAGGLFWPTWKEQCTSILARGRPGRSFTWPLCAFIRVRSISIGSCGCAGPSTKLFALQPRISWFVCFYP